MGQFKKCYVEFVEYGKTSFDTTDMTQKQALALAEHLKNIVAGDGKCDVYQDADADSVSGDVEITVYARPSNTRDYDGDVDIRYYSIKKRG